METFSEKFISSTFGGQQWSPGFYWIPPYLPSLLPNRSYYILDPEFEPYLPSKPGADGAKLTALKNDRPIDNIGKCPEGSAYQHAPVFISLPASEDNNEKRYVYYGTYSQTRYSDKMNRESDAGLTPGLRLCWEYLCCTGWDKGFYDMLVYKKRHAALSTAGDEEGATKETCSEGQESEDDADDEYNSDESVEENVEEMETEGSEAELKSDDGIKVGESASGYSSYGSEAVGGAAIDDPIEEARRIVESRKRGLFAFGERDYEEVVW